jgi:hypothetical protein
MSSIQNLEIVKIVSNDARVETKKSWLGHAPVVQDINHTAVAAGYPTRLIRIETVRGSKRC